MGAAGCEPEAFPLCTKGRLASVWEASRQTGTKTGLLLDVIGRIGRELSNENFSQSMSQYECDCEPLTVISFSPLFSEGKLRAQGGCVSGPLSRVGMNPQLSLSPAHAPFGRLLRMSPRAVSSPRGPWNLLFPPRRVNYSDTCALSPLGTYL